MFAWLRLASRHWFLLPPASLLLAVTWVLFLAFQESEPPAGAPRPVRRWSDPILEHRPAPRQWSAQDTAHLATGLASSDHSQDGRRPMAQLEKDNDP